MFKALRKTHDAKRTDNNLHAASDIISPPSSTDSVQPPTAHAQRATNFPVGEKTTSYVRSSESGTKRKIQVMTPNDAALSVQESTKRPAYRRVDTASTGGEMSAADRAIANVQKVETHAINRQRAAIQKWIMLSHLLPKATTLQLFTETAADLARSGEH